MRQVRFRLCLSAFHLRTEFFVFWRFRRFFQRNTVAFISQKRAAWHRFGDPIRHKHGLRKQRELGQQLCKYQGNHGGSISNGQANGTLTLTLDPELALAMQFNLGAITQSLATTQANGQHLVAKSALMKTLDSGITEEVRRLNLRTQGVESSQFPETVRFSYFDPWAVRLTQTVIDFDRFENLHGANKDLAANMDIPSRSGTRRYTLALGSELAHAANYQW